MATESDPVIAGHIGRQMQALRLRLGLTQKEAAAKVRLHFNQWGKYEQGRREAPPRVLNAIEQHLKHRISLQVDAAPRSAPTHPPEFYKGMLEAGRKLMALGQTISEEAMDGLSVAAMASVPSGTVPSPDRLKAAAGAVAVRAPKEKPAAKRPRKKRTG